LYSALHSGRCDCRMGKLMRVHHPHQHLYRHGPIFTPPTVSLRQLAVDDCRVPEVPGVAELVSHELDPTRAPDRHTPACRRQVEPRAAVGHLAVPTHGQRVAEVAYL